MITKFTKYIKENVDYSTYSKNLNDEEFLELYLKNCKNFNPRRHLLERGQGTTHSIIYIDASKHEVKLQSQSLSLSIFLSITEKSKRWDESGYPNKMRSLDVASKDYQTSFYGDTYIVIPYDNAEFMVVKNLIGNRLPNLDKIFHKYGGGNKCWGNRGSSINPPDRITIDTNPVQFCEKLMDIYEKKSGKKFSIKNSEIIIQQLKELESYIDGPIKDEMIKRNMNFIQFLDFCFDPIENEVELLSYNDLYQKDKTFFAWTTSELLLVEKFHYNDLKNKLCVIHDKKINI